MAASRRLMKELEEIRRGGSKNFRNIQVDEANLLTWQGLLVPDRPPYDSGAFRIEINFPAEYPFKPPKITFKTKIYHPNVDEKGQVCLPVVSAEHWKPTTTADQVIRDLVALVDAPQPEHPLRADLAEEYAKDQLRAQAWGEQERGVPGPMPRPDLPAMSPLPTRAPSQKAVRPHSCSIQVQPSAQGPGMQVQELSAPREEREKPGTLWVAS